MLSIPAELRRIGLGIRMLAEGPALPGEAAKADPKLVNLMPARTSAARKLAESDSESLADVAQHEG